MCDRSIAFRRIEKLLDPESDEQLGLALCDRASETFLNQPNPLPHGSGKHTKVGRR
jgi:hypothetical protein